MFARAQSGLPFTPLVQGDVNGDGRSGDRAFIPDPSAASDAALAAQMQLLVDNTAGSIKDCLLDRAGKAAKRNGCRGRWTQSLFWQQPEIAADSSPPCESGLHLPGEKDFFVTLCVTVRYQFVGAPSRPEIPDEPRQVFLG